MKKNSCHFCKNFIPEGLPKETDKQICIRGHSPQFYMPKHPLDFDFGFKADCLDYEQK